MKWEIIEDRQCYAGFFRLRNLRLRHELFSGRTSNVLVRELVERANAVAVLPYDPLRDEVVLIEQFRTGAINSPQGPWIIEIVAGLIEPGEALLDVALREVMEECGCAITDLQKLYEYFASPGGFAEQVSMFVGRVNAANIKGTFGVEEEGEDIHVITMKAEQAFQKLESGEFCSSLPIIALQWLKMNREILREQWV